MNTKSSLIVVSVTLYSGTDTPDKNGKMPVMLQCQAGRMPNRNVLSGTVAERMGIEVGETYLVSWREAGFDEEYGPDYQFTKVRKLESGEDTVRTCKEVGPADIFIVPRPAGYEENHVRKGNAVESGRMKRIKQGVYKPSIHTATNHETARNIVNGSSVENSDQENLTREDIEEYDQKYKKP